MKISHCILIREAKVALWCWQETYIHLYRQRDNWYLSGPSSIAGGLCTHIVQRFSRAGPRGRGREWATLGVHPLSWLLSNNRLEEVCSTLTKGTFSSRLLLSNQDKGCTPSVAHSLPLPLGPALLNLSIKNMWMCCSNGSLFLKKSLNNGCHFLQKYP